MQNLRRRMMTPLLAATVATTPLLGLAAPASASDSAPAIPFGREYVAQEEEPWTWNPASISVTSTKITKKAFTLRSSAGCANRAHITAALSGPIPTENVWASGVGVDIWHGGELYDYTLLTNTRGNIWEGDLVVCGKDPAGAYRTELYAAYITGTGLDDPNAALYRTNVVTGGYTVKRPASVTLNAAPEPVRKGAKITIKGTVTTDGRTAGNTKVQIWFKADGAADYTLRTTVTTDAKGAYRKTVKATTSGTWKVVVPGTGTRNEVAAYDAVKVKK
ncbi:hypothetical protein [Catenuloplanes atrovinosus]|uniref:Uncharacterized protein n=1 Tax=Catenuloplanes atrovinosus TaxID=137266 RepID=A0AAE3YUM1_9ACTN|nr:hypothetical protein [Catenuloplanes atrovinosus]MDR7278724.1 hypothetical protein [Catenuloplanes atrovinosus]